VTGRATLSGGPYVAGAASLVGVLVLLSWGAVSVRRALLRSWAGARARIAEAVILTGTTIGIALVLGSFGELRRAPLALAYVLAAAAMIGFGRSHADRTPVATPPREARGPREEAWVMTGGVALVAAQWATHIADALNRGMTHADTLWYHAPYAAVMVRTGHTNVLFDRTDAIQTYYPANSSLVHALVMLPFDRDFLSPFVNVAWLALALVSAWCIGRRRGVESLSVLGALVVCNLPMLGATQPGEASNDIAVAALLLAGVALLLEAAWAPVPMFLAGTAVGLAVGTKLTVLLPAAVLVLGGLVLAVRARAYAAAVAWAAATALFGSYWYIRNWLRVQNPLPWFRVDVGPIDWPPRAEDRGASLASKLGDADARRALFEPGFWQALGRVWPVILLVVVVTAAFLVFGSRRAATERLVGLTIVAGVISYLTTPSSGGPNFTYNVRYLTPVLLLAFVFGPYAFERAPRWARRLLCLFAAALLVLDATAPHRERVRAWPGSEVRWALAIGVAVLLGAVVIDWILRSRTRRRVRPVLAGAAVVVLLAIAGGWAVQRHFLERRYVHAGLAIDRIDRYFRDVRDSRVAVFGTVETYPFDGIDLSNRVRIEQGPSTRPHADPCRQWSGIVRGNFDYVVLTQFGFVAPARPPDDWFTTDPASTEVEREGNSVVYRLRGPLHPAACAQ
jgi:hypothetical protein